MTDRELEDRIRGVQWPAPSPALRDRTLSGAPAATAPITWSDRVWFSRGWRMTAAAAGVVLTAASMWSRPVDTSRSGVVLESPSMAAMERFVRDAGFPPDEATALTRRSRAELTGLARQDPAALLTALKGGS